MTGYVIEIMRGEDRVYLCQDLKKKPLVDPKERNALVFHSFADGKTALNAFLALKPNYVRHLIKVDDKYKRPLHVFLRRTGEKEGLFTSASISKIYDFVEVVA
ncbi:hypothetical protein MZD04_gp355 [Pseudomonas phage Psa21]|uniref:Uncharacterized protein n=1 Tax=Pseudomonas phage Psa21 TaxID=2530023 RepID=A0A481W4X9_9CAUD|nr:hypothetical protein MZD04_gp355 [Pseudomonas phage Psa21]QBJ02881.1 hypothetical protein PSA21_355 [Pseudomonas phage Psa21]